MELLVQLQCLVHAKITILYREHFPSQQTPKKKYLIVKLIIIINSRNLTFQVEALHIEQANTDFFILCELLKDYLGLLGSVRDTFHERTKLFQHWQHSQQMLTRKRETKTKLELNNRADKIDQAGVEVIEVSKKLFII